MRLPTNAPTQVQLVQYVDLNKNPATRQVIANNNDEYDIVIRIFDFISVPGRPR